MGRITANYNLYSMQGFIGFFDILGYSSFLENNTTLDSAEKVLTSITTAGETTDKQIQDLLSKQMQMDGEPVVKFTLKHLFDSIRSRFHCFSFSDTIVFTLDFSRSINDDMDSLLSHITAVTYAILWTGLVSDNMFAAGLPLRGCVHYGEYLRRESSLAGKGVIESYRLTNRLDLAASVLTPSFCELLSVEFMNHKIDSLTPNLLYDYPVPFNDGSFQIMTLVSGKKLGGEHSKHFETAILDLFSMHDKVINERAMRKVVNTAKLWHYLVGKEKSADIPIRGKESI